MIISEMLPIGTVILTEGADKKLMIIGVKPIDIETNTEYDYLTVMYPEGYMSEETMYFVNQENIAEVLYPGMDGEEQQEFKNKLEDFYQNQEIV